MNHHLRQFARTLAGAFTILLIVACAPIEKAAPPVDQLALPAHADRKKLERGRQIYATSCTHCHGPARIDRRREEKWTRVILPSMSEKAKLTLGQSEDLKQYVITARRALGATAAN
jgi:mono/diheme cytochrome c family protein